MLKKIYHFIVPEVLQWKIREKSPYYQRFLELEKSADAAAADFRAQLDDAHRQLENCEAEYRKQLETARCQSLDAEALHLQQLAEKQQQIEDRETQLETVRRQSLEREAAHLQQLAEKQQLLEACQIKLKERMAENAALTAQHQREKEAWQQELLRNRQDYQTSLRRALQEPKSGEANRCDICGNPLQFSFAKKLLNKYDVAYFSCEQCKHLQTEKPYWLAEAYQAPLSDSDTGQVWRNERNRDIVCALAQRFFPQAQPPKVWEYAAGYGLLTRMLRDCGLECFWYDKYAANVFARHFEDDGQQSYDLVLAFEALEHFEEPMLELENIFSRGASLVFSEILLEDPCPNQWWYLCPEHGQHVNFYSMTTLQYIAERFHKKLYVHEDVGFMTSLEISQEEFEDTLTHADVHARAFRESHNSLTVSDMNRVIKEMKQA